MIRLIADYYHRLSTPYVDVILPDPPDYREAIKASNGQLKKTEKAARAYWQDYLERDAYTPLKQCSIYAGDEQRVSVRFDVDNPQLQWLTKKYKTTRFILFSAMLGYLLSRYWIYRS